MGGEDRGRSGSWPLGPSPSAHSAVGRGVRPGIRCRHDSRPPRLLLARHPRRARSRTPRTGAVVTPIYQVSHLQAGRHRRLPRRLRVQPVGQPDPHRARGVHRRARGWRARVRFASGLAGQDTVLRALLAPGDHVVVPDRRLRRHLPPVQQGREAVGGRALDRHRSPTSTSVRAAIRPGQTKMVWVETPDQPAARHRRHRGHRRGRPRGRRRCSSSTTPSRRPTSSSRSRSAPTSSRTRRRSTAAATATSSAAPSSSAATSRVHGFEDAAERDRLPPERDGCRGRPVRRVAGAARPEDARDAHGAALRQRRDASSSSCSATPASARCTTRACPSHPDHDVAARQMKRFGGMVALPGQGRRGRRRQGLRRDPAVDPRRVARRRRVAHRAPGPDDARVGRRHRARGARRPDPPVRRHRGRRGPRRRPRPGARPAHG